MLAAVHTWVFCFVLTLGGLAAGPVQAQYYLNLSGQKLTLPNRTMHVEQVVDGRPSKAAIGVVYRGLNNSPATVLFRRGLEAELTTFLQSQLPARPTDRPIVLCLRQLRVSEQLNGVLTEKASADLIADVYVRLADGYHFVRNVAARTAEDGLETTTLHSAHVALLLQQCLDQVTMVSWDQAQIAPRRTLEQLANDVPSSAPLGKKTILSAILRQAPRRGVYYSFEQFLFNQPDSTLVVQADTFRTFRDRGLWLGVPRFRPSVIDERGKRHHLTKDAWGFSDGQQIYVHHAGHYFPLVRQGSFFTFIGEKPLDQETMRARSQAQTRSMVTGMATVNRQQDPTGEPAPYALDMRTGQLAPFPDPLQVRPARPDTAYVYLYRQADAQFAPINVFLDGHKVGQLLPNEYMQLPWPYYARMMHLCLGLRTAAPCQLLVPDAARTSYLRINAASAASAGPVWQWVPAAQGEADLDALDNLPPTSGK